jgi:hypothetical protein
LAGQAAAEIEHLRHHLQRADANMVHVEGENTVALTLLQNTADELTRDLEAATSRCHVAEVKSTELKKQLKQREEQDVEVNRKMKVRSDGDRR